MHPWYVQGKGWVPAYALCETDNLLTHSGESVRILGVQRQKLDEPIDVYNITVGEEETDEYHNYFVGGDEILVHNACKTNTKNTNNNKQPTDKEIINARQKAVRQHKKQVYDEVFVKGDNTRYNFTKQEMAKFREAKKIVGYDGCYIIDVSRCNNNLDLIGNPDNIVLLKRFGEVSLFTTLHNGNWSNPTNIEALTKLYKWVVDKLTKLGF